jgi:hypothetical protein
MLLTSVVQAQIVPSLELGYINQNFSVINGLNRWTTYDTKRSPLYSIIGLEYSTHGININTSVETWMCYSGNKYFTPKQVQFNIGINYTYKMIEFGYKHYCNHAIRDYISEEFPYYHAGGDKVYIKVKFKK